MEKRFGSVLILVRNQDNVSKVNQILSLHGGIILGRLGVPVHTRGVSVISIVLEGTTDQIGALTGQLGRLAGIEVKSVLSKSIMNNEKE